MEPIRQALERAKASSVAAPELPQPVSLPQPSSRNTSTTGAPASPPPAPMPNRSSLRGRDIELDRGYLETQRIIAHNVLDPRVRAYDMLRTQVLQLMDQQQWRSLAITSPTPGCGKSVTAINLAMSTARQPERSVLLIDMDLQRPQIARSLGLTPQRGLLAVLEGRVSLPDAIITARFNGYELMVLPAEAATAHSSELIASRGMRTMMQDIRTYYPSHIVIKDMPPALSSDDVIALVPQIDCALLVTAVGHSTQHEIKECIKLLQATELVRVVLNKAAERATKCYY